MSLNIIKAGICDTFQDKGRQGFQHLGINPGGAMDILSMQVANLLVGNAADTAVLEMHFPAASMLFRKPCLIAIGGADFGPSAGGKELPLLHPVWIEAGTELHFRRQKKGSWCYLAVYGGFILESWLGSTATHLKVGKGGWYGRRLQKGDDIPLNKSLTSRGYTLPVVMPWGAVPVRDPAMADDIAIVAGREWGKLKEESRQALQQAAFTITLASDRMGYSLDGPLLNIASAEQMISSAVGFGTLQLLPDGQVVVLMADHQTTGGYPCIGHVISAHLPKLAQYKPGDRIRFYTVELAEAQQLWLEQRRHLKILEYACRFKIEALNLPQ